MAFTIAGISFFFGFRLHLDFSIKEIFTLYLRDKTGGNKRGFSSPKAVGIDNPRTVCCPRL